MICIIDFKKIKTQVEINGLKYCTSSIFCAEIRNGISGGDHISKRDLNEAEHFHWSINLKMGKKGTYAYTSASFPTPVVGILLVYQPVGISIEKNAGTWTKIKV